MSDWNTGSEFRNPDDPYRRDTMNRSAGPDARAANAMWGWIAAAVFVVVILAVAFGMPHQPGQNGTNTAANDVTSPPAASRMAPPPAPQTTPAPNANGADSSGANRSGSTSPTEPSTGQ